MNHLRDKDPKTALDTVKATLRNTPTAVAKPIKALFEKAVEKSPLKRETLKRLLLILLAVVLVPLPLVFTLPKACSSQRQAPSTLAPTQNIPDLTEEPIPFDRETLKQDGGFYTFETGSTVVSRLGIDVSFHQGLIDWDAVAGNGIGFAFIRIGNRGYTVGDISLDSQFETNYSGATQAGLKVGVYFFSQAINESEAREEADFVLRQLAGRTLDYPVAYDFETVSDEEGRANALSSEQRGRNARAFCERIETGGYTAMLYGNVRDVSHYYSDPTLFTNYDVWLAQYNVTGPSAPFNYTIWQFTSDGVIDGINTRVDLNLRLDPGHGEGLPDTVVFHEEEPL